jgi:hypothetical protein
MKEKDVEMSKEEKKLDLKPIAEKEGELKSWVGLQRPFLTVFCRTATAAATTAVSIMPHTGCIITRPVSYSQSWDSI